MPAHELAAALRNPCAVEEHSVLALFFAIACPAIFASISSVARNAMSPTTAAGCDNEYWPTCADEYWPTPRCLIS
jgi:hypothetical protein